jgi:hypothetical protein
VLGNTPYRRSTGDRTHDDDFLKLAVINQNHSGIAYCHQTKRSVGQIIETLLLMYEVYTPEDMIGRVEFL